jgi:hypothetical protein
MKIFDKIRIPNTKDLLINWKNSVLKINNDQSELILRILYASKKIGKVISKKHITEYELFKHSFEILNKRIN